MKLFVGLVALFLLPGSAIAFWDGINIIIASHELLKLFLIGVGIGALIYSLLLRKWNYFLTFEHEFTHAFMSLLFFRRIDSFVVTGNEGGYVQHSGGFGGEFGNIMISMAPYFFPTFTIILLLFQPLIPQKFLPEFIAAVGFTFMFHFLSTAREIVNNWSSGTFTRAGGYEIMQTDIARTGFVFSFIFIITMTLFFDALVFWFLKYGYYSFISMSKVVFAGSLFIYKILMVKVQVLVNSLAK